MKVYYVAHPTQCPFLNDDEPRLTCVIDGFRCATTETRKCPIREGVAVKAVFPEEVFTSQGETIGYGDSSKRSPIEKVAPNNSEPEFEGYIK